LDLVGWFLDVLGRSSLVISWIGFVVLGQFCGSGFKFNRDSATVTKSLVNHSS